MSNLFEHIYKPIDILNKIKNSKNIKFIYLNHPDFDYSIKNNIHINLNCEHTFLIEHDYLIKLFNNYGFKLNKRVDHEHFSLFLEFERIDDLTPVINQHLYNNIYNDSYLYIGNIIRTVNKMNDYIHNNLNKQFFIWPTSMHLITFFTFGLNHKKLSGVLDNSPNKIGKYFYGYNLLCSSFDDLLTSNNANICIFICNAGNYIKELDLSKTNIQFIFTNEL
jgi:hypothetical protein